MKSAGTSAQFLVETPFRRAFPEIAGLRVAILCLGSSDGAVRPYGSYDEKYLPGEMLPCANPECRRGGSPFGELLRHMVRSRIEQWNPSRMCLGYFPRGRPGRDFEKCMTTYQFDIRIRYRKRKTPRSARPRRRRPEDT